VQSEDKLRATLRGFIVDNFLFGDVDNAPADDDSLLERGFIDSTGVLELIEFLEAGFAIRVAESETVPENLGSIARIAEYIARKRASSRSSEDPG
jgi:acyl carrier protein